MGEGGEEAGEEVGEGRGSPGSERRAARERRSVRDLVGSRRKRAGRRHVATVGCAPAKSHAA